MNDISKLRDTIVPKSDQLNADDLLAGPLTVKVVGVKRGDTSEQPISIEVDGGRQPYKPCKSMRRVMITAWGDDGRKWIGQSMRLYCDPDVKFGGVKVGGIRISHMTGIHGRVGVMLTTTRSKRSEYVVEELRAAYISADQEAKLRADLDIAGVTVEAFCKMSKIDALEHLAADRFAGAEAWIKSKSDAVETT